jgi:hypothetical protein
LGGEEILLKVIIQSILRFAMGVFKLPKHFWKNINNVMATILRVIQNSKIKCTGVLRGECVSCRKWVPWVFVIYIASTVRMLEIDK